MIAATTPLWLYPNLQSGGRVVFPPGSGASVAHWRRIGPVNRSRMRVFYSGQVQGVGFRYSVRSVATGFDVTGTIRNLPDGRVELVAEGACEELDSFRQAIRESGMDHFIEKEEVVWDTATNQFRGFEIVR